MLGHRYLLNVSMLLGLFLLAASCSNPEPGGSQVGSSTAVKASVIDIVEEEVAGNEEIPGTVQAGLRASIESRLSARITALPIKIGQSVNEGALLAELDAKEIQAKLDQMLAVQSQAENDLRRSANLVASKAVPAQEFDAVKARAEVARASVDEVRTMLTYSQLRAPFSGKIARKFVEVGDLALPGKVLLEIEDPQALNFETDIPEGLINFISEGQTLQISIPPSSSLISGRVLEVSPTADQNSRTFHIKVSLPPTSTVRTGQFGRVLVPGEKIKTISVPRQAIIKRGQLEYLFISEDAIAKLRIVRLGKELGENVQVLSGLSPGERIIFPLTKDLREGVSLEIVP